MSRPEVLVAFVRGLRANGIPVGPAVASDLLAALETVGASSAEDVYWAFRSLTVSARDHIEIFDRVFLEVFGWTAPAGLVVATPGTPRTWAIRSGAEGDGSEGDEDDELAATVGASSRERLADRDFAELTDEEEAEVRTLIAQMVWRPADVRSRRHRSATVGRRPDLRRTLRRSVSPTGDLLELSMTMPRIRRRPLIIIADVSGSMERYAEMLLYFAHAAKGTLGPVESFVFSTRLTRITHDLDRRRPADAIARVAESVHDWSGGTRIGEALGVFNRDWSRRVARRGPIALIISDGWDRGEPETLAFEMARLRRSVHRVVWLNPLAGREGYAPETRGMKAAMPYIDDFLAAGTLRDLETLVTLLESVPPHGR